MRFWVQRAYGSKINFRLSELAVWLAHAYRLHHMHDLGRQSNCIGWCQVLGPWLWKSWRCCRTFRLQWDSLCAWWRSEHTYHSLPLVCRLVWKSLKFRRFFGIHLRVIWYGNARYGHLISLLWGSALVYTPWIQVVIPWCLFRSCTPRWTIQGQRTTSVVLVSWKYWLILHIYRSWLSSGQLWLLRQWSWNQLPMLLIH